jgi:hypothetical protein
MTSDPAWHENLVISRASYSLDISLIWAVRDMLYTGQSLHPLEASSRINNRPASLHNDFHLCEIE